MTYSENQVCDTIMIAIQALEALHTECELREQAEAQLEAEHKLLFADAMLAASDGIRVSDLAIVLKQNGVEIGEHRLYQWLRDNGYVARMACGTNRPTQKSMELGVMELKRTVMVNGCGKTRMTYTIRITPKGQAYFIHKVMAQKEIINAREAAKKEAAKQQAKRKRDSEACKANCQANKAG